MVSKYTIDNLPEGWRKTIVEIMGEGGSMKRAYKELGLNAYAHGVLMKNPEYEAAMEEGQLAAQVYWEKYAEKAARAEVKCDRTILIFLLKNRLGWHDQIVKKANKKDKSADRAIREQYAVKGENHDTIN